MLNKEQIKYIGVNDNKIDLFESQYVVPNGVSYNSYLLIDEKIAVLDTVEINYKDEWLDNLKRELNGRVPTYLIVQHMEPDHSSNIVNFLNLYPDTIVVGNMLTFRIMDNFFRNNNITNRLVVNEETRLSLGSRELRFFQASMVHWPEVMMTYDIFNKTLFTADAFGKFGALDTKEDWLNEARRYYFGIVGKYGEQVQMLFDKIKDIEIDCICPLHGPVLESNIPYYIDKYNTWSNYEAEESGVAILYTSVYGNTRKAVQLLKDELDKLNIKNEIYDLSRTNVSYAISIAFKYDKVVLASTTYNSLVFPPMDELINNLIEREYKNRDIYLIENGSWSPQAAKVMRNKLINLSNVNIKDTITIRSSMDDNNVNDIKVLASKLK